MQGKTPVMGASPQLRVLQQKLEFVGSNVKDPKRRDEKIAKRKARQDKTNEAGSDGKYKNNEIEKLARRSILRYDRPRIVTRLRLRQVYTHFGGSV